MKLNHSFVAFLFLITIISVNAQNKNLSQFKPSYEKVNALIHTKLNISFDFEKQHVLGEAWLTLEPHFYPTQTLTLDAKAMLIESISINNTNLEYHYNNQKIKIQLNKTYNKNEPYTVHLKYTARPNKVTQKGSSAITDAKGLYFIDPLDTDPDKPTQIWTQGETESNSCWFPTIDAPNQKTTQELYITVPNKFITLSNGTLVSKTENNNNTRTDYWKMDQKHAPYLTFIGVGAFEIIEDQWNGIEMNYYVEKEYAPYAKGIFGKTPKMMQFFTNLLEVPFVWDKYNQIVVRDFVSGAMENTTAVVHSEMAYQTDRQLIDENKWENTIAHELFHHWFGDLVTAESWSNISMNESFANYSEYLWLEHEYGKNEADAHLFEDITSYKNDKHFNKNLVRYYYEAKEDVFDAVSYNKGGSILHMLRNHIGDKAFFAGLKKYLNDYKFQTGEAHQLRLTFEDITGKDLNWFFNQWFFGHGHPKVDVSYDYNTLEKTVTINLKQAEHSFNFPLKITVFEKDKKNTHDVFIDAPEKSFTFSYQTKPKLIVPNADYILISEFNDPKTLDEYIYQYKNTQHYVGKREAMLEIAKHQDSVKTAFETMKLALNDPYYKLQILALKNINLKQKFYKRKTQEIIKNLAVNHPKTLVKAAAISVLGKLADPKFKPIFSKALESKSNAVVGNALESLYYIDSELALQKAKTLTEQTKKAIATPLVKMYIEEQDTVELPFIANYVLQGMFFTRDKEVNALYEKAYRWIAGSNNKKAFKNLATALSTNGNRYRQWNFHIVAMKLLREMVYEQEVSTHKNKTELIAIAENELSKLVEVQ